MSEKGQGQRAGPAAGPQASPPNGGDPGQPGGPASGGASDATDTGGQRPVGSPGGGGGAKKVDRPRTPASGEIEFEDGTRLSKDEQGDFRYRDQQGRTGLWKGGDEWVDESTGQPMPSDFKPKTPGDHIGPLT